MLQSEDLTKNEHLFVSLLEEKKICNSSYRTALIRGEKSTFQLIHGLAEFLGKETYLASVIPHADVNIT